LEIVGLLPFVLGCCGLVIGSIVVWTMPASVIRRLVANAVVFLAAVIGVGLVIVGVVGPLFGLVGSLLLPVLTSIGLRRVWSRRSS
jgi:hypothetical protein